MVSTFEQEAFAEASRNINQDTHLDKMIFRIENRFIYLFCCRQLPEALISGEKSLNYLLEKWS